MLIMELAGLTTEGTSWCESLNIQALSWPAVREFLKSKYPATLERFAGLEKVDESTLSDIRLGMSLQRNTYLLITIIRVTKYAPRVRRGFGALDAPKSCLTAQLTSTNGSADFEMVKSPESRWLCLRVLVHGRGHQ